MPGTARVSPPAGRRTNCSVRETDARADRHSFRATIEQRFRINSALIVAARVVTASLSLDGVLFLPTDDATRKAEILAKMPETARHVMISALEGMRDFDPDRAEAGVVAPSLYISADDAPLSDLPHLFDSFYRGQNVGSTAGSGLGLAVVKRAVDVQGGTIEVHSECGRGTAVSVCLPLESNAALSHELESPSVEREPSTVAAPPPPSTHRATVRSASRNA